MRDFKMELMNPRFALFLALIPGAIVLAGIATAVQIVSGIDLIEEAKKQ